MKVFVVKGICSSFPDTDEWHIATYDNEESAVEHLVKLETFQEESLEKIANSRSSLLISNPHDNHKTGPTPFVCVDTKYFMDEIEVHSSYNDFVEDQNSEKESPEINKE